MDGQHVTIPYAEISYKCRVAATDLSASERIIDDSAYYKTQFEVADKYIRLELLKSYPHDSLNLAKMKTNGVKATFQGPTKVTGVLENLLKELDGE